MTTQYVQTQATFTAADPDDDNEFVFSNTGLQIVSTNPVDSARLVEVEKYQGTTEVRWVGNNPSLIVFICHIYGFQDADPVAQLKTWMRAGSVIVYESVNYLISSIQGPFEIWRDGEPYKHSYNITIKETG